MGIICCKITKLNGNAAQGHHIFCKHTRKATQPASDPHSAVPQKRRAERILCGHINMAALN